MAYRKSERWVINVPQRHGPAMRKHVGTTDGKLAARVEKMCEELAELREWKLIEALNSPEVPLPNGKKAKPALEVLDLYDAWTYRHQGALDKLRERLDDTDLTSYVEEWLRDVERRLPGSDTAERYELHLRSLMPEGRPFARSRLAYRTIVQWLAGLKVSDATRRKYRAALSSFCEYLVRAEVIPSNPVRSVPAPAPGKPRQRYLALHDITKLVEKQDEPFRTLSALMHGTGMEISAALRVKRADVDVLTRKVRAHGTKTHARDREVYIEPWAWTYVERAMKLVMPNALLFPGLDRWSASDAHRAACKALGDDFSDYRMHDARHSYAVRAIKAGASLEHVARQLGHADTQMVVKVYGRYKPTESERLEYQRIAELQDAERAKAAQA
jgi:integrase/recombinase XerD